MTLLTRILSSVVYLASKLDATPLGQRADPPDDPALLPGPRKDENPDTPRTFLTSEGNGLKKSRCIHRTSDPSPLLTYFAKKAT